MEVKSESVPDFIHVVTHAETRSSGLRLVHWRHPQPRRCYRILQLAAPAKFVIIAAAGAERASGYASDGRAAAMGCERDSLA